jgi:hypothetical protein
VSRILALLAFVAALFFFLLLALSVGLGDVDELAAGLTSLAAGFLLERIEAVPITIGQRQ